MSGPPPCPCVHWLVHNGFCCECRSAVDWFKGRPKNCTRVKDPGCDHSMSYRGYCFRCFCKVDLNDGQLFNYISQGTHLTYKFVASIKRQRFGIGLGQKKLHLVVDLQHVLLDSRTLSRLSDRDKHLINQLDSRDNGLLVKLRPFARDFLREANELFTIYAYTKSDPDQARNFIKLLDPLKIFFPSRFITRADEMKKKKSLEFVLAEERGVVILDCNSETWDKDDHRNLLLIKSYHYFREEEYQGPVTKFINSFYKSSSEEKKDEEEEEEEDDGSLVDALNSLKSLHQRFFHGQCKDVRLLLHPSTRSGVTQPNDAFQLFNYLAGGLSLSHEFVGSLKSRVSRNSLQEKKLHLVLSLYGTFFDSQAFPCLFNREKYLKGKVNSRDLWQTRIRGREVLIKLRPFAHEFLREANKLFILHVHTLCIPEYADFVLKLLDPHQLYFGNGIITSGHIAMWTKTLDLVLAGEREVIILDDRYDAWWPENRSNLLQITTYSYFKATKNNNNNNLHGGIIQYLFKFLTNMILRHNNLLSDSTSYSEERKDESVEDGALANALRFLTKVHHNFFNQDYNQDKIYNRDVRVLLHS